VLDARLRFVSLDRAIKLGFYGATYTSAAERAIEEHMRHLISQGKITEMTAEELAKGSKEKG
jgi:hypothetical protein